MIPQFSKFPLRTDFVRFRTVAKKILTPHTIVYYLKSGISTRLSVVVPKKLSPKAVTRNWLKRLTYDTLWPLIQDKNFDCVIVYKPLPLSKTPATQKELINELTQAISNL